MLLLVCCFHSKTAKQSACQTLLLLVLCIQMLKSNPWTSVYYYVGPDCTTWRQARESSVVLYTKQAQPEALKPNDPHLSSTEI